MRFQNNIIVTIIAIAATTHTYTHMYTHTHIHTYTHSLPRYRSVAILAEVVAHTALGRVALRLGA